MYNYTLIIPHKNTPDLLQRCLDSVPQRDDLNIIIVDDNSDPNIVDFENFPGGKRPNTTLIFNKDGLGAGHARNVGLDAIKETKWVFFSDSDDFFAPYLNEALDKYVNDDSEIVYFKYKSVDNETLMPVNRGLLTNQRIDKAVISGNFDILRYKVQIPYCKFILYKNIREHKIRYDETMYSNDVMFALKIGSVSKKIKIDTEFLYIQTDREGSLVKTIKKEAIICRYNVAVRAINFLKQIGKAKYHSNLFAYCYKFAQISNFLSVKYFIKSLKNTPFRFWHKDICDCIKELFRL